MKKLEDFAVQKNIGFSTRSLIIGILPYTKTPKKVINISNGDIRVTLSVSDHKLPLPYGTYPRIMLLWLITEAIKSNSREINLGKSISRLMEALEINITGGVNGTINRFKEQLKSLLNLQVNITGENKNQWVTTNYNIAEQASLYLINKTNANVLFESKILLSQAFFDEIKSNPIPIDLNILKELRSSPLAIDIYCWLTYKLFTAKNTVHIPFDNLFYQFGYNYEDSPKGKYEFKRKFTTQLNNVTEILGINNLSYSKDHIILKHTNKKELRVKNTSPSITEFLKENGTKETYICTSKTQKEQVIDHTDSYNLLDEILKIYNVKKSQIYKYCDNKTKEEIKDIIGYINDNLMSGKIKNPAGFIISAFKNGYTYSEIENSVSILQQTISTIQKKEEEIISITSKAYQQYKAGYRKRLDAMKLELKHIPLDEETPLKLYLDASRKSYNIRENAINLIEKFNIFERLVTEIEYENIIMEEFLSTQIIPNLVPEEQIFLYTTQDLQEKLNSIKLTYVENLYNKYRLSFNDIIKDLTNIFEPDHLKLIYMILETHYQIKSFSKEDFKGKKDLIQYTPYDKDIVTKQFIGFFLKRYNIIYPNIIKDVWIDMDLKEVIQLEEKNLLSESLILNIANDIKSYISKFVQLYNCSSNCYSGTVHQLNKILEENSELILDEEVKKILTNDFRYFTKTKETKTLMTY